MLQDTPKGSRFKAGDVAYLRVRVEGFDTILPGSSPIILIPIHKDGKPCAHDGFRFYAQEEWLIQGQVVKAEIENA